MLQRDELKHMKYKCRLQLMLVEKLKIHTNLFLHGDARYAYRTQSQASC